MEMNVQLIQVPPIRVLMLRHIGPYDQIGPKFEQLWAWIARNNVPAQRSIGVYWDNPDFVPPSQCKSAACAELPLVYSPPDRAGTAIEVTQLHGGEYAMTTFVGPYEELAPVWSELTTYVEESLRRKISTEPAFEVYVNDPSATPPHLLKTELFMPLG